MKTLGLMTVLGGLFLGMQQSYAQSYEFTTNCCPETLTIEACVGVGGYLTVPGSWDGLPIVGIANGAFISASDTYSISIPSSITNIAPGAFVDCFNLQSITVSSQNPSYSGAGGVLFDALQTTLVAYPFDLSGPYTIPGTVTNIVPAAFAYCTGLSSITFPNNLKIIGTGAFQGCTKLSSFTLPTNLAFIGSNAFEGCSQIGNLTIPASVTNIGVNAFGACADLQAFTVDSKNSVYSSSNSALYNKSQTILVEYPAGYSSAYFAPYFLSAIGDYAFFGSDVTSFSLGPNITNIGVNAFGDCKKLTSFNYGGGTPPYTAINGVLFNGNQTSLLAYPGGVGGSYAIPNGVTNIADNAFYDSLRLNSVTIPSGVRNIGVAAFYGCSELTSLSTPATLTNIGSNAFYECGGLTSLNLSNGLLSIGEAAFADCSSLTSVSLPDSVTNLAVQAFEACQKLVSVSTGNGLTEIQNGTFVLDSTLANVNIGTNMGSIDFNSFSFCSALGAITIPASVTNLGGAFFDCNVLNKVYFDGNAPTVTNGEFLDDSPTLYYLSGTTGWGSSLAGRPAVLWNPKIQASGTNFGFRNSSFGFTVTGPASSSVIVQAASDLANGTWTNVQSLTLSNGTANFIDPAPANTPARFYRISSPFP
jgi:hypothetical protein